MKHLKNGLGYIPEQNIFWSKNNLQFFKICNLENIV